MCQAPYTETPNQLWPYCSLFYMQPMNRSFFGDWLVAVATDLKRAFLSVPGPVLLPGRRLPLMPNPQRIKRADQRRRLSCNSVCISQNVPVAARLFGPDEESVDKRRVAAPDRRRNQDRRDRPTLPLGHTARRELGWRTSEVGANLNRTEGRLFAQKA